MDTLESFVEWFFKTLPPLGAVPLLHAVHKIEDVTSITWYREGQFQVQMFAVPGNYIIPEHTHPNVDSYEIYVGGQIKFSHSGKWVISDEELETPGWAGTAFCRGKSIRVKPHDVHGGAFGPAGGVFLSAQHWLNGVEPHCVAADYEGIVMGSHHLSSIKHGDARLVPFTLKDAASKETVNERA